MPVFVAGVIVLLVLAAVISQSPNSGALRTIGRFVTALFALGSTAVAGLLFWVGMKAHWTSDGPGMLLVMIGIVFFGVVAFVSWSTLLGSLGGGPRR